MSYNITLNSSNVVQGTFNNTYQYNFLNGSFVVPDGAEISISQITLPYSWVNVSAALGNNVLGYAIPNSTIVKYYSTNLADGFYTLTSLNSALQALQISNGHYWVASGVYYYPLSLSVNSVLYTNTITATTIPTSANITTVFGSGATSGSWNGGYPTTLLSTYNFASLFIPQNFSIGNILGFVGGSSIPALPTAMTLNGTFYPTLGVTGSASQTIIGNSLTSPPFFAPSGSSVNGIIVRCNLVDNSVTGNSDIMDSFPITTTYGSNLNYQSQIENWRKMKSGKYQNLTVYFQDQNLNPLRMLDNNVLITLLIRFPK